MKKYLLIGFLIFFISPYFTENKAEAICVPQDTGPCIEIPSDVSGKSANCPLGNCNVYTWCDGSGLCHWVCDNGNGYTYTPPIPQLPQPPWVPEVPNVQPPTATPTTPQACDSPCRGDYQCTGAKDGCTSCIDSTCKRPPTPTASPVPSVTPTRTPTPIPSATPVPSATPTATPRPSATPTALPTATPTSVPTATPTPLPFDESMCKCDGLDFSAIALGTTTNVTAYGKVLGVNKNYAKIPTFKFKFFQGNGTVVKELKNETVNTTIVEETAEKTRYKADWSLNLPSSLDTTQTYRIQAVPVCSRAAALLSNPVPNRVVLASNDARPKNIFQQIASFFAGIFGMGQNTTNTTAVQSDPTPTLTAEQKRQLQLKTFKPARGISTDNCSFVKFNF